MALFILSKSFVIARGTPIIILERLYFGKPMPDVRTVALATSKVGNAAAEVILAEGNANAEVNNIPLQFRNVCKTHTKQFYL